MMSFKNCIRIKIAIFWRQDAQTLAFHNIASIFYNYYSLHFIINKITLNSPAIEYVNLVLMSLNLIKLIKFMQNNIY